VTDTAIHGALCSAVADVLERMFFLEGLPEAAEPPADAETFTVNLTFDGDPPGRFEMRLSARAASAIAADFLGEDAESLTSGQSADVTLELANMICGAVLSRTETSATFRLGTPQLATNAVARQGQIEQTRYTVETGNGTLTAAIQMETRTCPPTER
jgi:CheY-specific phosphatase CheX